jgi:hypothetical protein
MSQRVLYKHLSQMGLIKYPLLLKENPLTFSQWIALSSERRYQLKKTYKKYNIEIPTQENEY